ncbi:MAG: nucleotide exchange factor GrpE [Phycisphaerales bacterium]|nr:nucleotide exchange factor GrpE [Phycisphaeraceae bacterium]
MNPFRRTPKDRDDAANTPSDTPRESTGTNDASSNAASQGDAHADPDATASLLDELQDTIRRLTSERDAAIDAHKRALADFQNYQRRAIQNEHTAREQGVRSVLTNIIPVLDHFDLALTQDASRSSAKQVIDGVTMIKDELVRVLGNSGVQPIRPGQGSEFDPTRHEAVMHMPAENVPAGKVVMTLRIGYMLGDRLVRPAQVAVAPEAAAPSPERGDQPSA